MYFLIIPLREEVLAIQPDGIMLSNGPGDPEEVRGVHRLRAKALR